jgi:hypothetical protein
MKVRVAPAQHARHRTWSVFALVVVLQFDIAACADKEAADPVTTKSNGDDVGADTSDADEVSTTPTTETTEAGSVAPTDSESEQTDLDPTTPARSDVNPPDETQAGDDSGTAIGSSVNSADGSDASEAEEPDVPGRNLLAEPAAESEPGLEVTINALEVDTEGRLRWFFVIENHRDLPACNGLGPARLYAANDELLALGTDNQFYGDDEHPGFFVGTWGTFYRRPNYGLFNCIAPGGHGIGVGDFAEQDGSEVELFDDFLARAVRVEFDLDAYPPGETFSLADDLVAFSNQTLTDTPEGKVAKATITGHAQVIGLVFHAALFAGETPVDLVTMVGGQIAEGESKDFEMPPGNPKATRFEMYLEGNLPQN